MKRTIVVLSVVMLALSLSAFAAQKNGAFTSPDGLRTYTPPVKSVGVYMQESKDPVIFGNLATKYPKGEYFCCEGGTISGASSIIGEQIWDAVAFTPASNSHVTQLKFAISYVYGTYTDVLLGIYADCSGVPCSSPIKHWTVTLMSQPFGSCCALETHGGGKVSLTAGTQYWVVASTEAASDIWAAWNVEVSDQVDYGTIAQNSGGTWYAYSTNLGYSLQVGGTIP